MGLIEAQRLLARLSTDKALRARFRADPTAVAAEFGLSALEAASISRMPPRQLDDFAGSLVAKRRGEVQSLLPLTFRAIGPTRFAIFFRRHAAQYLPTGIKKHRTDAIAFADFLAGEADPSWLADLVRLEGSSLLAHDPARGSTVLRLRHHPDDLTRAALQGGQPGRRASVVAWIRLGRRGRLRRVVLAWPFGATVLTSPRSPGRP